MEFDLKDYERFQKQIILKKIGLVGQKKIKKATKPKKLTKTKKNCKKLKETILLSNIFESLKFLIEKKIIKKDKLELKTNE